MSTLDQGFLVRGADGVDVYPCESGYVVEHFRLLADDHLRIVWRSEPCETREQANVIKQQYRAMFAQ